MFVDDATNEAERSLLSLLYNGSRYLVRVPVHVEPCVSVECRGGAGGSKGGVSGTSAGQQVQRADLL